MIFWMGGKARDLVFQVFSWIQNLFADIPHSVHNTHANAAHSVFCVNLLFTRSTRICTCIGYNHVHWSFQCQPMYTSIRYFAVCTRSTVICGCLWVCDFAQLCLWCITFHNLYGFILMAAHEKLTCLHSAGYIYGTEPLSIIWLIIDSNRYGCNWITARNPIVSNCSRAKYPFWWLFPHLNGNGWDFFNCQKWQLPNGNSCKLATQVVINQTQNAAWQNVTQISCSSNILLTSGWKYHTFHIFGRRTEFRTGFVYRSWNIHTVCRCIQIHFNIFSPSG